MGSATPNGHAMTSSLEEDVTSSDQDWRSTLRFSYSNRATFPIELFLSIVEFEASATSMDDKSILRFVVNHLDDASASHKTALMADWDEARSFLMKEYGSHQEATTVEQKVELLNSLTKGRHENGQHYLIRVRYVANLIQSSELCQCPDASEEWAKVLFWFGLHGTDQAIGNHQSTPSDLEEFAESLNLSQKSESQPDDSIEENHGTPEEAVLDIEIKTEEEGGGAEQENMEEEDPDFVLDFDDGDVRGSSEDEENKDYKPGVPVSPIKLRITRSQGPAASEVHAKREYNKKPKQCKECHLSFKTNDQLRHHVSAEHKEKVTCQICNESVVKAKFWKHTKDKHKGMKLKCDKCDMELPSVPKLRRHIASFHESDLYKKIEMRAAEGKVVIEKNPVSTEPSSPMLPVVYSPKHRSETTSYRCAVCAEVIKGQTEFAQHVITQHDGKRFKCDGCEYTSNKKQCVFDHRLKLHGQATKGVTIYHCKIDECKFKTVEPVAFNTHLNMVHEKTEVFSCQVCSKDFFSNATLKWHIEGVHMGIKRFKCDQCDVQCYDRRSLKLHMDTHLADEDREKLVCDECGSSFVNIEGLKSHIRRVHRAEKNVQCPHCPDKWFFSKSRLMVHLRGVHQEDKRFVCPHCNRGFSNNYTLNCHINVQHLKVKSFRCKLCNTFFSKASNLTYHIGIKHLGFSSDDAKANRELARQHEAYEVIGRENNQPRKPGRRSNTTGGQSTKTNVDFKSEVIPLEGSTSALEDPLKT